MTIRSPFRSAEGELEYQSVYDATLREVWPAPYEEIEIRNRFGITHVVAAGRPDATPLVLLHAFMFTSVMWGPYVEDFTRNHRIYAIDSMGQPSKSIPDEPVRDRGELLEWLIGALDGLGLGPVPLAGISFGGWTALNAAILDPERVSKLVLLSPAAGFQPLRRQFGLRAALSGIIPTRRMMDSFMRWAGLEDTPGDGVTGRLLDLMWTGGRTYRMPPETRRLMPTTFSDEELRGLEMPVLLLIGDREVIYDPAKALARARRLVPLLESDLVPDCSHDMAVSRHRAVSPRVRAFLEKD